MNALKITRYDFQKNIGPISSKRNREELGINKQHKKEKKRKGKKLSTRARAKNRSGKVIRDFLIMQVALQVWTRPKKTWLRKLLMLANKEKLTSGRYQ